MKLDLFVLIFIILFSPALVFAHPGHEPEDILLEQGLDELLQRNFEKAISLFDIILEHNPNNVDALNNEAESLIKLGKYQDAFIPLNQVMRFDPENKKAVILLQFIEFKLDYKSVDGFMEIQVYNSQGFLVTHFVTRDLYILNNTITENAINAFPVKKIFNRDGQEYE